MDSALRAIAHLSIPSLAVLAIGATSIACYPIPPGDGEGDAGSGVEGDQTTGSGDAGSQSQTGSQGTLDAAAEDAGSLDAAAYPTNSWSAVYLRYFYGSSTATNPTMGHCASSGCHDAQSHNNGVVCTNKLICYSSLQQQGLITGTNSTLVNPSTSPLEWINVNSGSMPEDNLAGSSGAEQQQAAADMFAWADAGALNN